MFMILSMISILSSTSWVSHENRISVIYTTSEAIARSRDYYAH